MSQLAASAGVSTQMSRLLPRSKARGSQTAALLSVVAGLLALGSIGISVPWIRCVLLLPLVGAGIGTALAWPCRPPLRMFASVYPAAGIAVVVGTSTMLLWLGWYTPTRVTVGLAGFALASGGIGAWYSGIPRIHPKVAVRLSVHARRVVAGRTTVVAVSALALVAWGMGVMLATRNAGGEYGLLVSPGGVLIAVALITLVVLTCQVLSRGDWRTGALLALIFTAGLRAPASLLTEAPLYAWTYKHIGLVDYIQRAEAIPPPYLDIYNRWPGLFAGAAWFSSATKVAPVDVAHWFAVAIAFLVFGAVWSLARACGATPSAAVLACLLAQAVNWVGQDYYSPQAIAYVMAIATIVLWLDPAVRSLAGISVLLVAAIVITHQLTPLWLIVVGVLGAILGFVRPKWSVVVAGMLWLAFVVPRIDSVKRYGLFNGFNPLKNARTNVAGADSASLARTVTELTDRGLALGLWCLAVAAIVVIVRDKGRRIGVLLAVLAFSSFVVLAGQSYGGESIFRVYLYSVPGCATAIGLLVARLIERRSEARDARRVPNFVVGAVSIVGHKLAPVCVSLLVLAGGYAYYASWSYSVIESEQVAASEELLRMAGPTTWVVAMAPAGWPQRPAAEYVKVAEANPGFDRPIVFLKATLSRGFPTDEDVQFLNRLGRFNGDGLYLVFPEQISIYSNYFGYFKAGAIERLIDRLDRERQWRRVDVAPRTVVFKYNADYWKAEGENGPR